ncbi:restriction endonuclease [Streptomyces sp. B6B3]|uniref:restriction endonuclease n=1 Tax=Streptomyces sp. B6B3 TaxID=3153570 RepID=UPI00325D79C2
MSTVSRPRLRKPRGRHERVAATAVALAAAVLVAQMAVAAWHVVLGAWPALVVVVVGGLLYGVRRAFRFARAERTRAAMLARLRIPLAEIDAMDDGQFEHALRDLLIRDGWTARHVGRKGDQVADVIGDHPRRGRIVIQAKHTQVGAKVGCSVMYQVNGTAGPVHRADVGVVVTNGGVTSDAMRWGDRHRVLWTDRDRLRSWAERGVPLHDLLRLPERPSRRPRRLAGG